MADVFWCEMHRILIVHDDLISRGKEAFACNKENNFHKCLFNENKSTPKSDCMAL